MANGTAERAIRIPLDTVTSSNIAKLGYDLVRHILAVQFKSGDIYHYAEVLEDLVMDLCQAESKGRFYTEHVKGKFTGQKMTGECPKCGAKAGWVGDTCTDCGCAVYEEQARPVVHALAYGVAPNGRNVQTDCGLWLRKGGKDLARSAEGVSCLECKDERARVDADEEPF